MPQRMEYAKGHEMDLSQYLRSHVICMAIENLEGNFFDKQDKKHLLTIGEGFR